VITLTEKRLNELESKAPDLFTQIIRCRDDVEELKKNSATYTDLSTEIRKLHQALSKQKEEISLKIEHLRESFNFCKQQISQNIDDISEIKCKLMTADSQIAQISGEVAVIKVMIEKLSTDSKGHSSGLKDNAKDTKNAAALLSSVEKTLEKLKQEITQVKAKAESLPVDAIQKNIADIMQYLPNTKDKILNNDDINAKFKKIETTLANLVKNVIQGQMK